MNEELSRILNYLSSAYNVSDEIAQQLRTAIDEYAATEYDRGWEEAKELYN